MSQENNPDEDTRRSRRVAGDDKEPVDERTELPVEELPDDWDADEYCANLEAERRAKYGPNWDITPPEKMPDDADESEEG